jgi:hypothetical protein
VPFFRVPHGAVEQLIAALLGDLGCVRDVRDSDGLFHEQLNSSHHLWLRARATGRWSIDPAYGAHGCTGGGAQVAAVR